MNAFDDRILSFISQTWLHPPALQGVMMLLAGNDLLKGGVLVAALWWIWMQPDADQMRRREVVVISIVAALIAAGLSRSVTRLVPFRPRPFDAPGLHLDMPLVSLFEVKGGSFPSDHMALAFALVTGVFLVSRRVGLAFGAYALLFVGLPRMYLGIHWATDVIGGSVIGIAATALLNHQRIRSTVAQPAMRWHDRKPGMFYACMFLVSFGLMKRFEDFREIARVSLGGTYHVLRAAICLIAARW